MARRFKQHRRVAPDAEAYFVATYPPRNCGIATFTYDLAHALANEIGGRNTFRIVALNNRPEGYDYADEVTFEIGQNQIHDYRLAAEYINVSRADLVCLQHEFGIFGGPEGSYVTHLLRNLRKPIVSTLHTVLKEPNERYRNGLIEVAQLSHALVVMSRQAEKILQEVYGVPAHKIHFIHHGVPDVPFIDPNFYKDRFNVEGRMVLLTFGLLGPNKGIELVLQALPRVIERHPHVAYIILGATHPEVKRVYGEAYRLSLQRLVNKLGLEKHVIFHNRFVTLEELCEFIGACDMYITPYLSREQITSGTLAYALGMGKAVISTPYWYAEEMLADGRGRLVPFGDAEALARTIIDLLENEVERHLMRKRAYELGREMRWSNVAKEYLKVFHGVLESFRQRHQVAATGSRVSAQDPLPDIKLDHLFKLTDETGILQHASYGVPDRRFGYSTDDVARALVVVLSAYDQTREERCLKLADTYLAFLKHAQLENGRFHNFMSYARKFTDGMGSEDTLGRALWGLGCAVHLGYTEWFRALARELFEKAAANLSLEHPMAKAYAINGFYHFLQRYPGATGIRKSLQTRAEELLEAYRAPRREGWRWFSDSVTYGNARIPYALLLAYKTTRNDACRTVALEALDFLTEATFKGEYFDFVGNSFWFDSANGKSSFDQQPLDAGYAVEAYLLAHEVTGNRRYLELARAAFEWFLGRNRLGVSLYDFASGACYDGLTPQGPNLNQGAESTIAFLLANLAMSQERVLRTLKPDDVSDTAQPSAHSYVIDQSGVTDAWQPATASRL